VAGDVVPRIFAVVRPAVATFGTAFARLVEGRARRFLSVARREWVPATFVCGTSGPARPKHLCSACLWSGASSSSLRGQRAADPVAPDVLLVRNRGSEARREAIRDARAELLVKDW